MKLSEAFLSPDGQPPFELSLSSFYNGGENALIRIATTDDATTEHVKSTFVLVIDESGSMGDAAVRHDDTEGGSGLSQLDVVKHAARTIVETLSDQDRLSIVAFSNAARVVMPLRRMTNEQKKIATTKIYDLYPRESTNLYDGLHAALEIIRTDESPLVNANILLLTDGMPNVSPPRGELETLKRYLDAHSELRSVKISTFGFGYELISRLLFDIAQTGSSAYAFIPDSSFVGTIFINAVSNLLSAAVLRGATLKLEASEGVKFKACTSGHRFELTSWGMSIDIPSILYGQCVDVFVQFDHESVSEPLQAILEMSGLEKPLEASAVMIDPLDPEDVIFRQAAIRSSLVNFINSAEIDKDLEHRNEADLQRAQELLEETKKKVRDLSDGVSLPGITAMQLDLNGQISEAYSTSKFYKRWGSHYVLSLASAHTLQQCNNFKDPGVQDYVTGKFLAIRDISESIFLKLKPPQPSRRAKAPIQSMNVYYSQNAPCFASGLVTLESGETIQVTEVRPGDNVKSSQGYARVRCIVETPIKIGVLDLVELEGGVLVTPWHPVRRSGGSKWVFPCFLAETRPRKCDRVYSFVLEGDVSIQIGPFDGIALGHGVTGDSILQHDYLGTQRVIDDLSQMVGWDEGHVRLAPNPIIREGKGGLIVGFLPGTASEMSQSKEIAVK